MLRHWGCQWLFDWQRHRLSSANGGTVWQLVVMRMGRRGRGFVSASAAQRNQYLPPEASLCSLGQREGKTAMLALTPRLQHYSSEPLNEWESGGRGRCGGQGSGILRWRGV